MKSFKLHFSIFALFSIALLSSCEATLAPAYDQAIVEKVTASSDLAMRFFAEVDGGTQQESFCGSGTSLQYFNRRFRIAGNSGQSPSGAQKYGP